MRYERERYTSPDELGRPGTAAIPSVAVTAAFLLAAATIPFAHFEDISGMALLTKASTFMTGISLVTVTAGIITKIWAPVVMAQLDCRARPMAIALDYLGDTLFGVVYELDRGREKVGQDGAKKAAA